MPPDDVAPFNRVDLGFTWRASKRIELAVWGQNLLQESHVEYRSTFEFGSDAVPRSFWGRLTTRF